MEIILEGSLKWETMGGLKNSLADKTWPERHVSPKSESKKKSDALRAEAYKRASESLAKL